MALDLGKFASIVRVGDGAWGTQLQAHLPAGGCPELLNVDNAAVVEAVAASYVEAGSDVILTNTFGANRFVLAGHGLADRTAELAEAGAAISRRAADKAGRDVKVFASIGPTGKIVMMGEVSPDEYAEAFYETAAALARGGADAIVLETFAELDEIAMALEAVRSAVQLPVVASMTFASGPDGTDTMMGNSPADLAQAARDGQAAGIGANCGAGPDNYIRVAAMLREASDLPIWIKPNAGRPVVGADGKTVFPMGSDEFAARVTQLIDAGATMIGGCCGTTPDHIRAVRSTVDARKKG